ncbi:MAG TPA: hypothetical protein DCZ23_05165, partial [Lachnospiraceae bacterium]|nr:hypothetical protein [Lachnospiraceae bacterium]
NLLNRKSYKFYNLYYIIIQLNHIIFNVNMNTNLIFQIFRVKTAKSGIVRPAFFSICGLLYLLHLVLSL